MASATISRRVTPRRPAPARPRLALTIQEASRDGALPIVRPQLRRWVQSALEHDARLLLRFVDAAEGRRLNRDFRLLDRPTNVLTFNYATGPVVEADIVICIPVVLAEATAAGIAPGHHLAHLVIHGVLHAQGYDHEDDAQALRMETREAAILHRFGISDPYRHDR